MKILYVCGMYVPSHGGAEISVYTFLKNLQEEKEFEVLVFTDERYENTRDHPQFNKLKLQLTPHEQREENIERTILDFKPDVLLTQLMWSDVALKLASKHSIPSIMRVCKVPLELDLSKESEYAPTKIISTSNAIKDYVRTHWDRDSVIIKPLINLNDYIIGDKEYDPANNNLIFMFNPLERKGGGLFKEIARKLPQYNFGTVKGWSSLKNSKNSRSFSREYIKRITESEGSTFDGGLPNYIDFSDCENVTLFDPEDDPRRLYEKIRILLIPSQWEEAFGRVAVEAMINGIPVIASDVAGLKDAVGSGGKLIDKKDINAWVRNVEKLMDDKSYYSELSSSAKEFANENYSEEEILEKLIILLNETIKSE